MFDAPKPGTRFVMGDKTISADVLTAMTAGWASTAAYKLTAAMIAAGEKVDGEEELLEIEAMALEQAFEEAQAYAAARGLNDAKLAIDAGLDRAIAVFKKARVARSN
jgi:hypothetical protein